MKSEWVSTDRICYRDSCFAILKGRGCSKARDKDLVKLRVGPGARVPVAVVRTQSSAKSGNHHLNKAEGCILGSGKGASQDPPATCPDPSKQEKTAEWRGGC